MRTRMVEAAKVMPFEPGRATEQERVGGATGSRQVPRAEAVTFAWVKDLVRDTAYAALAELYGAFGAGQAMVLQRLTAGVPVAGTGGGNRLLSLPEVAEALSIPEDRAYDLARQRKLPVVTIGKYKRVRPEALAAYIEANEDH